jgi:NADH-quinone oxidoreductase subunit N
MMNRLIAATSTFEGPAIQWFKISPILALLGGALFLILVGSLTPQWKRGWYATASVVTAVTAAVLTGVLWNQLGDDASSTLVGGALAFDHFALFATFTICVSVALASLVVNDYLTREGEDGPEVYGLILAAAIGGVVMVSANDLLVLFLGLETLSLSFYLLTASSRSRAQSGEAGLKYFILGGFASAFFLYGVALLFGASGTTNLQSMATVFAGEVAVPSNNGLLLAGIAMLLVGFAFKVSLVPFHVWTPDVYQGAPTPITGFMAAATKAAAFGATLRIFYLGLDSAQTSWKPFIAVIAVITMIVGSIAAISQRDMKRMLAFSSIAHAGFILTAVVSLNQNALSATLFYLVAYGVATIGAFGVITLVRDSAGEVSDVNRWVGLGKKSPLVAAVFSLFLLSFAGIPLTSGFVGKFSIFSAAYESGNIYLVVAGVLSSAIAVFFYLRVILMLFFADSTNDSISVVIPSILTRISISISVVITIVLGIAPSLLFDIAQDFAYFLR